MSKMAASVQTYLENCVNWSILAQFNFVMQHFNWLVVARMQQWHMGIPQ